jgi:hypothetical protein
MKTRRELIMATTKDLISDFLFYDRKEDEDLPSGAIEDAIASGEISVDEIVAVFKEELEAAK